MTTMTRHPEQRDDELYLGNTDPDQFHKSAWVTKRMGNVARYGDGRAVESAGYGGEMRPWFILRSEVEQKIRTEEAAQGPNWTEKVRDYRDMLDAILMG